MEATATRTEVPSKTDVLSKNVFLVKEHVGLFKAASNFDIYDPETGAVVLECREELGLLTKIFRFTDYKRMTPFNIQVRIPGGPTLLSVRRGISIFLSKVQVFNGSDTAVGGFKQKLFSIGGKFDVLDANDTVVCSLKGKWTGWEFSFTAGDVELGRVTKKWAGIGKELFTSADNYVLTISEKVTADNPVRLLILAAVLCIDFVLKE